MICHIANLYFCGKFSNHADMFDTMSPSDLSFRPERNEWLEWPTLAMIMACYGLWAAAGLYLYEWAPVLALLLMAVCVAMHSSLQHEIMHGHPTRNALVNEALVFLPLGLTYPFRRYKVTHMQHHRDERLTDPYDDPESYYLAERDWHSLHTFVKIMLRINSTFLGRLIFGPAIGVTGFLISEWPKLRTDPQVRNAWLLHIVGLIPVYLIVELGFGIPFWLYALVPVYMGLAVIGIRTYCEHQWFESPDGRTVIVEKSLLSVLFLYNNLHIVHHRLPTVAWYRLPRLYQERRQDWQRLNNGYVFPNYFSIFWAFAFKSKEPTIHPALYGDREPAEAVDLKPTRVSS
jgi:fatty acid desaturase